MEMGCGTVLQLGEGSGSCPRGEYVLYINIPLLSSAPAGLEAKEILNVYLDELGGMLPHPAGLETVIEEEEEESPTRTRLNSIFSLSYFHHLSSSPPTKLTTNVSLVDSLPIQERWQMTCLLAEGCDSALEEGKRVWDEIFEGKEDWFPPGGVEYDDQDE